MSSLPERRTEPEAEPIDAERMAEIRRRIPDVPRAGLCNTERDRVDLLGEVERLRSDLQVAETGKAFYRLAIKERDYERVKNERLEATVREQAQTIETVKALADESGVGWYEFIRPGGSTTHVCYAHESGDVYVPEPDVTADDFTLAASGGRAWKLVRASGIRAALAGGASE